MKLGQAFFGALFLCLAAGMAVAQTVGVPPLSPAQSTFVDQNGLPIVGGKVYFYIPNTTTPKNTYADSGLTTLNPNPITLDSSGRALVYGSGAYREQVYDSSGNLIWDQITVSAIPAGTPQPNTIATTNTTASTSTTTGAIVDAGGLGVGGAINIGGALISAGYNWNIGTGTGTTPPLGGVGSFQNVQQINEDYNIGSGNTYAFSGVEDIESSASATGGRQAFSAWLKTKYGTQNLYYDGLGAWAENQGGDGRFFGIFALCQIDVGSAATTDCIGQENDTDARAPLAEKVGLQIVSVATDANHGSNVDAGLFITSQSGGVGYENGIQLTSASTDQSTGAYFRTPSFILSAAGGHILFPNSGTAPTLTGCGTGATLSGSDTEGLVSTGTGSITTCTITFGSTFAGAPGGIPNCILQPYANTPLYISSWTANAIVVATSAVSLDSDNFTYFCPD